MAASDQYVELSGGLTVPADAIRLGCELEARGFTMSREADDLLFVQPSVRLTGDDCARLRRWKWHLLALLDYRAPMPAWEQGQEQDEAA